MLLFKENFQLFLSFPHLLSDREVFAFSCWYKAYKDYICVAFYVSLFANFFPFLIHWILAAIWQTEMLITF